MRNIVLGPSGSGKTVRLQNMILELYKDCFARIYMFSPSSEVDASWLPVKEYINNHIEVDPDEVIYFDNYDSEALRSILDTQHKIRYYTKKCISSSSLKYIV